MVRLGGSLQSLLQFQLCQPHAWPCLSLILEGVGVGGGWGSAVTPLQAGTQTGQDRQTAPQAGQAAIPAAPEPPRPGERHHRVARHRRYRQRPGCRHSPCGTGEQGRQSHPLSPAGSTLSLGCYPPSCISPHPSPATCSTPSLGGCPPHTASLHPSPVAPILHPLTPVPLPADLPSPVSLPGRAGLCCCPCTEK